MPSDRLRVLLRGNHARLERPRIAEIFSPKLGVALGDVHFLSLAKHDRLANAFWDRWSRVQSDPAAGTLHELFETREQVEREIDRFRALPDCPSFLLFDDANDVGAIHVGSTMLSTECLRYLNMMVRTSQ